MEKELKEKISVDFAGNVINLIIDKSGRIIAHGPEFHKLIPAALPNIDFFDLFEDSNRSILQNTFLESKRSENISFEFIELKTESRLEKYKVGFYPLRSENNVYFLVSFITSDKTKASVETQKFWFASTEIDKLTDNKKLISVFNKIKLTYPFTFIEKAKIQKEINDLQNHFWIKDTSGKYLIVNDKFANAFGFKPVQIENKYENDFLPKYLTSLYKIIDQYVTHSSNAVVIEGISIPIMGGNEKGVALVEFPLSDLDNHVIAIIGFSKDADRTVITESQSSLPELYDRLPFPIILLDDKQQFISYSSEFIQLFSLNEKLNYIGVSAEKIFEKGFIALLENFISKADAKREYTANYVFIEKLNINVEVNFLKIFDKSGNLNSTQISFTPKSSVNSELESKSKMYDGLISQLSEAMFIYDTENLKFLEVNDAALKLYGYKRSDFLNMDLTDLYAPEDIQTLIISGDSKSSINGYSGPWRHKKSDGSSIMVEINRSTIDFLGKKAHLNIVKDVYDKIELRKRQQILESNYENSNDAILLSDKDGFITDANESATKKLGYPKRELESRPFISLVSDDDRAKVNKLIFHSGILKTTSVDIVIKKAAGSMQKALLIATPIKSFSGDVENYNLIVRINEETDLSKENKHGVMGANQNIDAPFLSNVFHEILTPINVILGFTQELGESISSPNEEQKEAVDIIRENQKLLLQIMDNAVEFSTLEQKIVKLHPEDLKFVDLLDELRENVRKTAESKKVDLAYGKISSSLVLESDKQRILSLLSLFIKFAIQITKENTIYLSATIHNNDYCAVGIKDSKNLITPYLLKAFTDIFAEDENLSRRNYGFSRFSVKLAKKLIELLSAQKETLLKDGEPSEFALILPLKFRINDKDKMEIETKSPAKAAQQKKAEEQIAKDKMHSVKQIKSSEPLNISQLSCLYLEDQVDSQMLFKVQMKDLKSIEFAPSFENALPLLKTKKFDFIVMDINLQGEYNGLDALRIIQKMPGYKDIPIIASTAYIQPGARDSFIAAGFSEFVSKPLLRDKLLLVLTSLFS